MILPTPEQKEQWEEEGYLVFEDAIQGEDLKRLLNRLRLLGSGM